MSVLSLMYGLGTVPWTVKGTEKLKIVQRRVGRSALEANKSVGVEAIRGDVEWSMFREKRKEIV